jgi:hypothetical protein
MLNLKKLGLLGTNLAALLTLVTGAKAHASAPNAREANAQAAKTQTVGTLNQASLRAIESSWLLVPASCKARGFNAEPIALKEPEQRSEILALYLSLKT